MNSIKNVELFLQLGCCMSIVFHKIYSSLTNYFYNLSKL